MLRLHDNLLSPEAYAVRLMLALLGLPHETLAADPADAPILEDGSVELRDAGLILTYLARAHGQHWLPAEDTPEISRWLAFGAIELSAISALRGMAVGEAGELDSLMKRGRAALGKLDARLAATAFVAGDRISIADIALFPATAVSDEAGIGLGDYPNIERWQRHIRALPGFIAMPTLSL